MRKGDGGGRGRERARGKQSFSHCKHFGTLILPMCSSSWWGGGGGEEGKYEGGKGGREGGTGAAYPMLVHARKHAPTNPPTTHPLSQCGVQDFGKITEWRVEVAQVSITTTALQYCLSFLYLFLLQPSCMYKRKH